MYEQKQREKERWETSWEQTRTIWETIVNMSGKASNKKVNRKDLIQLSYDESKKKQKLMTPAEVDEIIKTSKRGK